MTYIVALSGKKGSGKNSAANSIVANCIMYMKLVHENPTGAYVDKNGSLIVKDLWGDTKYAGGIDMFTKDPEMKKFLDECVHPWVKLYSFADLLKEEVCIKVLGLTREQCFGTDEQKNELTHLMWENMPTISDRADILSILLERYSDNKDAQQSIQSYVKTYHSTGCMTAREVMQYVGTDIFRKMYGKVWVDATIRKIQSEDTVLAIVTDCRFPDEVEGVQKAGGKVVRLTRDPFDAVDSHESETALDEDNYDQNKFDAIITNELLDVTQQGEALNKLLNHWNIAPGKVN